MSGVDATENRAAGVGNAGGRLKWHAMRVGRWQQLAGRVWLQRLIQLVEQHMHVVTHTEEGRSVMLASDVEEGDGAG